MNTLIAIIVILCLLLAGILAPIGLITYVVHKHTKQQQANRFPYDLSMRSYYPPGRSPLKMPSSLAERSRSRAETSRPLSGVEVAETKEVTP